LEGKVRRALGIVGSPELTVIEGGEPVVMAPHAMAPQSKAVGKMVR